MEKIILDAKARAIRGKQNTRLRADGKVPAVVYGRGIKSEPVALEAKEMERVYRLAGGSKIIGLKVDDHRTRNVLIQDVQQEGRKGSILHVDFYAVRMDEELRAEVPLHFVGESKAVYQDEGVLVRNMEAVEVECLPANLPESIEVDISKLDDFEKTITVADLAIPEGVKLTMDDTDMLVARVEPPRSDEEMAELEGEVGEAVPDSAQEESPIVVAEENEGDKDRRDKK